MAISASKAKRLAAKEAKAKKAGPASKGKTEASSKSTGENGMSEQLKDLKLHADRTATGVLTSQSQSRDIQLESYSLSFHGRNLIQNATVELNFGRRYGLMGANGSGKSTFLRSLAEQDIKLPEHIDTYVLNEEAEPTEFSAVQYVIKHAEEQLARLEKEVETILGEEDGAENPVLDDLYARIESLDASRFESQAGELLHGLGFTHEQALKPTKALSGGWRMRVALAKALFIRPTLLLLDEPTNHLDLEAVVWLETFLQTYERILVVVSHSQDFLNSVCTNIIHLDHKQQLVYYGGNYDTFVRIKSENEANQMRAYEKQQAEIEHIKKFVASAGTYANLVRQGKSKLKIIDKMEAAGLIEKVLPPIQYSFRFTDVAKLPPPVLSFDEVAFAYDGVLDHALYTGVNLAVDMDSRVALLGPNGTGKSTLLKLMTNELEATAGRVQRHNQLKVCKYNQHSADQLDMEKSPVEYLRLKFKHISEDTNYWRQNLGKFGLTGNHQVSPIGTLSDGLRSRLVFCELALERPHIILLDEPTNHLDIESIDSLAEAIHAFSGGIVLVSHDFRLINQVAGELWLCEKRRIQKYDGTITEYKAALKKKLLKKK
ncbi:putative ABC transporter ATP-binding protein [Zancudomyces culisetae]|uniref:Putative ABC transporter ATP-binding protein n=1 Tax=Zancudomyces culisetae TaxID=1213189 RepID=A0A1R1PWV5_ZANCU|nr:putative ABC transporter ATP-binding protein [Zancudomyces culisetae]|eukprot:OMH85429.1 putative ABC transporter ATP-binding protein [Zancudomyces culisetae]